MQRRTIGLALVFSVNVACGDAEPETGEQPSECVVGETRCTDASWPAEVEKCGVDGEFALFKTCEKSADMDSDGRDESIECVVTEGVSHCENDTDF
jgi:hypothetical protein